MSAPAPHAHGRTPVRRRGHQHHPRLRGERQPAPSAPANNDPSKQVTLDNQTDDVVPCVNSVSESQEVTRTNSDDALSNRNIIEDYANIDDEIDFDNRNTGVESRDSSEDDFSFKDERSAGDGAEVTAVACDNSDDDPETAELAKLRCPSECTEVLAERENRRNRRRCADYPGLAFGSSIFSSDTMMKFSIIKNELQNIKNTALKRVMSYVIRANVLLCVWGRRGPNAYKTIFNPENFDAGSRSEAGAHLARGDQLSHWHSFDNVYPVGCPRRR